MSEAAAEDRGDLTSQLRDLVERNVLEHPDAGRSRGLPPSKDYHCSLQSCAIFMIGP
jgi:hypothetical protein